MYEKTELRRNYLRARQALSAEEATAKSEQIIGRLTRLEEFKNAREILSYVSSKDNEVETRPLIKLLLGHKRPVLVPIAERNGRLTWSQINSLDELVPSRFKILEPDPKYRRDKKPSDGALLLVPGIAFTTSCDRIGYGWGYFDRFLTRFSGTTIGLGYNLQIVPPFTPGPMDVPLDIVLTESATYRRRP